MTFGDAVRFAIGAIFAHRLRSSLTMLGIVIGVASVVLLTSLGEGTRRYLVGEFTQFGTNILGVNPGRIQTTGIVGAVGGTIRPLTLDDSMALLRLPGIERIVPVAFGMARVSGVGRGRSVFVYGVNSDLPAVWKFAVGQGRFLPEGDLDRGMALAVLGPKVKREIFGDRNALGEHVRVAGRRFLVIGVMAAKGQLLGLDVDDAVYVPVATALELFNRRDLMEIDVQFTAGARPDTIVEGIRALLTGRHDGEEDFTITTQTDMLAVMDRVLDIVSIAVGGIGAISLIVGAIGILTMMWISVGERTAEIGLARAVGAGAPELLLIFLLESALLSLGGGAIGVTLAVAVGWGIRLVAPGLPFRTPPGYVVAALAVSLGVGLASGVLPARRAARLDPIESLRAE
ncbi:MAG: ABC transporter permease [Acidobacteriota bacterium]